MGEDPSPLLPQGCLGREGYQKSGFGLFRLFLFFFPEVWKCGVWSCGNGQEIAGLGENWLPQSRMADWSICWIFAATEMQTLYLLFIMQLSQSSQHLWHGRAVHLHQDLQKVSAMRNYLLLTFNSVLACCVGKSLSQTKLVTIQLAKTATGKSLLETFPSSPVSTLGNNTCHFLPAFL